MVRVSRGALVEYAVSLPPLVLMFEFNPEQISRSRTITVRTGNAPAPGAATTSCCPPRRRGSRRA